MNEFTTGNGIFDSIIASVLFQIAYFLLSFLYNKSKSGFLEKSLSFSNATVAVWLTPIVLLLTSLLYLNQKLTNITALSLTIYSLIVSFVVLSHQILKYRKAGIIGLDLNISNGVDYKMALNLTKRSLRVLGTGADKLTINEKEFLKAIDSATRQRPAKLLLCHPESPALAEMAKRDKKQKGEYVNNVIRSLERIKTFQDSNENIEIRFYRAQTPEEMPIFRLMFFNDHYCLCSFNSFGNKDKGTTAPQLHLRCPVNNNGKMLYYRAFDNYFENLWEQNQNSKVSNKTDWQKLGL